MSESKLEIVLGRIRSAKEESPIAVYRSEKPGYLEAHFASTYNERRQQRMRKVKGAFLGFYHSGIPEMTYLEELKKASRASY